ncbi:cytochrome P450, partial [Russula brevipes]
KIHTFVDRLSTACSGGLQLAELFPWIVHLGERFSRWEFKGREHYRQHAALFDGLLNPICNDIAKGSERPSVSASLIKNSDRSGLSNHEISWLLGSLYAAGAETTATTLIWWALAMVANPEVQTRAQDELDAVVGRSRTPTFADAPSLPYIQALVKESLRWRPALPLGIAHATTEDNWYEGMFIPKGTICAANLWQCHHDPAFYGDDAASFNPERFLDRNSKLVPGPAETRDDGHFTYGFGRRACVGKHMANDSLFIAMATVLWAARLERAQDESGNVLPLDTERTSIMEWSRKPGFSVSSVSGAAGSVVRSSHPLPYKCKITPRFPRYRHCLRRKSSD